MLTTELERQLTKLLAEQRRQVPAMTAQDAVKLVFQALLGPGHLLSDAKSVTARVCRELSGLLPDPAEPLTEDAGPHWCRLNLRRCLAEGLPPQVIAGLMRSSPAMPAYTREDVARACALLLPALDSAWAREDLSPILNENWLPSHSTAYHLSCQPAYRVISADWVPALDAVGQISRMMESAGHPLVTLDGPCASGKTTLARRLAEVFDAQVVHTDDYVIPHARKTAERLARPGGNCDAERLHREVVLPWKVGRPVRYQRYDCAADALRPVEELPAAPLLIIEGCYSSLPALRQWADTRLFLSAPRETRLSRLTERESPESLQRFHDLWIPLEEAYFEAFGLPDEGCVIVGQ